ncbi:hypothetical protein FDE76_07160 [Clostridium botulinum]|uniref:Uncharacterized protein n=1 Tax=Clostridium botulinum (strain Eklund 17B / Type B) TaxID=935198 RepID=B2TIP7_CLOBB|nr:hypothetical protein [Clostridium sp. ZBS4]ACD23947.1 conserved hypothetical protein [Clostridium botulinum B str. Eklund 17B (NRP)]MBY6977519.1 hypothetical protein [Clostridium botulinum]MBY7001776.1 hypothetical protein [Clostridium botulinum]MCR1275448.1 hypothetical protein [Clostridium botulinum]NFD70896.1 hypothetical protein [Clostridium botulinum]
MKYDYSIFVDDNGYILFKFIKELKLLEYVFEDMSSFGEPIFREFIKKVISDESKFEEVYGNMCGMKIRKDYTVITSEYVSSNVLNNLQIKTIELLHLIDMWIKKNNL